MTILLSRLQYIWISKKSSLVITETVIYTLHSAHGWSVDGTGAVTPSVALLKDLFGGLCCRFCTAHTVGPCYVCQICTIDFIVPSTPEIKKCWSLHAGKHKILLSIWWKRLVLSPHLMDCSPRATDFIFSENYMVFLNHYLVEWEGKTFYVLLSWEHWIANK